MPNEREGLFGVCGFYCGSCPIHIAYRKGIDFQRKLASALSQHIKKPVQVTDIQCPGCRQAATDKDSWGFKCKIRNCVLDREIDNCSECKDFPCEQLLALSDTYDDIPITQLQEYNELGLDKWLELMEVRWKCQKCTGAIEASTKKCGTCNKDHSQHVNETIKKQPNKENG